MIPADTIPRVADTVAMVVRLDADLHTRLKAYAEANDRTMAAEVRRALLAHLGDPTTARIIHEESRPKRADVEPRFKR